jgi:hypothetical protein
MYSQSRLEGPAHVLNPPIQRVRRMYSPYRSRTLSGKMAHRAQAGQTPRSASQEISQQSKK